jgi:hypothetical protein
MWFDRERIFINLDNEPFIELNFPTPHIKDMVSIYREGAVERLVQSLPKDRYAIKLDKEFLVEPLTIGGDYEPTFSTKYATRIEFIDGVKEFEEYTGGTAQAILDNVYSINFKEGYMYLPAALTYTTTNLPSTVTDTTITYYYKPREYLEDFEFGDNKIIRLPAGILIRKEKALVNTTSLVSANSKVWHIERDDPDRDMVWSRVYPKSLQFKHYLTKQIIPNWTEVGFINGKDEFEPLETKDWFYSVDYKRGVVYSALTPFKGTDIGGISGYDDTELQFEFTNYFAEYQIAQTLTQENSGI